MNITKEIEMGYVRRYDEAMADLNKEIAAYEKIQTSLEAKHMGKWAIIHDGALVTTHDSFEAAADYAVEKFGRGPFLIRRVGASPMILPVTVMFRRNNGKGIMRV